MTPQCGDRDDVVVRAVDGTLHHMCTLSGQSRVLLAVRVYVHEQYAYAWSCMYGGMRTTYVLTGMRARARLAIRAGWTARTLRKEAADRGSGVRGAAPGLDGASEWSI